MINDVGRRKKDRTESTWVIHKEINFGVKPHDQSSFAFGTCNHRAVGCVNVNGQKALAPVGRTLFVDCTTRSRAVSHVDVCSSPAVEWGQFCGPISNQ